MLYSINHVTPFVGVWIEIENSCFVIAHLVVTPFVGVWIEIREYAIEMILEDVTPFVGVWIEINVIVIVSLALAGHSLRGSVD